jgi:hypothetical protein
MWNAITFHCLPDLRCTCILWEEGNDVKEDSSEAYVQGLCLQIDHTTHSILVHKRHLKLILEQWLFMVLVAVIVE